MINTTIATDKPIHTVLRDVKLKRDAGTEESYILTLDLENGETLDLDAADAAAPGAKAAIKALESSTGKAKTTVTLKGEAVGAKLEFGYFDTEGNWNLVCSGHGKVLLSRVKAEVDNPTVMEQRIRMSEDWSPGIHQVGQLFRRLNRELLVDVTPLQKELFETQKANKKKAQAKKAAAAAK